MRVTAINRKQIARSSALLQKTRGERTTMASSKIRDSFCWTDDEVELLLKVTHEYKSLMAAENVDWESSQSKYGDIFDRYRERYPSREEAAAMGKEYPHKKEDMTKGQLTAKLKAIRIRYRQAVDSGRRSGHGRVVLLYFEQCGSIWGGSPPTHVTSKGIETSDVEPIDSSPCTGSLSVPGGDRVAESAVSAELVANRRQRLDATLSSYRRDKLKRKFSTTSVALEDLDIKRRLLQRLETTDDEFVQTMGRWSSTWSSTMDRLNSNIELLVQHVVGSGTTQHTTPRPQHMTPCPPHTTPQTTDSYGHTPTRKKTHLEPHQTTTVLTKQEPIDPAENLEGRMCKKHDRPLELYCKTDQICVCQFCTESDHKLHHIVPLAEEYEGKKTELGKTEAEIHQMIQERKVKIQEINQSVELSKEDAAREISDSVLVFTALVQSVERGQAELIEMIEEKQKTTEKQAEVFIKELEQEISELLKRTTEVEQLSHTEDQLHLLQSFPSLNPPPPTRDWTEVRVHGSYEGSLRRAVAQLEQMLSKEMENLFKSEVKKVQQYAVDVTLDPDTAHPNLILSEDGKQVNHSDVKKNLSDNPERFNECVCVLGKQSFSSGRFYYEVQVKGKSDWDLGVARWSINRKGVITLSPKKGNWTILLRNGNEYKAGAGPDVLLSLKTKPQKVGVFVDYEEGLVSFYDVDAAALIYSYTGCTFTEKLYSYFSPFLSHGGKNNAPLIISPVNHTD